MYQTYRVPDPKKRPLCFHVFVQNPCHHSRALPAKEILLFSFLLSLDWEHVRVCRKHLSSGLAIECRMWECATG